MKTSIPIETGKLRLTADKPPADHPVRPAGSFTRSAAGSRPAVPARPVRVQVVIEEGFNGRAIDEILRREHRDVMVDTDRAAVIDRVAADQLDVVLLCSNQSGRPAMEMLTRITAANPGLPVIVVTSPSAPTGAARSLPRHLDDSTPPPVDAALLLRSVREALAEPRVKRLIRLTGCHGEPQFVARNARWLSEDLQARFSSSFHWPAAAVPVPSRMAGGPATSSQPL